MNNRNKLLIIFLIVLSILFLLNPNILFYSVMDAFNLFYDKIYLVLFPFLILGNVLVSYNVPYYFGKYFGKIFSKAFDINKSSVFLYFLSMITGFPTGAVYINKLHEENIISENETIKLLSFSFFPSPMFVINVIGIFLLDNILIGFFILITLYISNFLLGLIIRNRYKIINKSTKNIIINKEFGYILKESIITSFNTLLLILGNITIFIILSNIIFKYINFNDSLSSILSGILEMTNGIKKITDTNILLIFKYIFITFILSFSGFSVHSQVKSILNNNINYKEVFKNRILATIISIPISILTYLIFIII